MLIAMLCIVGVGLAFVFLCMICHAGKLSDQEFQEKEREWLQKGIKNGKK